MTWKRALLMPAALSLSYLTKPIAQVVWLHGTRTVRPVGFLLSCSSFCPLDFPLECPFLAVSVHVPRFFFPAGNYAYCTVIQRLDVQNRRYRVLALSATPGTNLEKVQDVVKALHVSAIEVWGAASAASTTTTCVTSSSSPTLPRTGLTHTDTALFLRLSWRPNFRSCSDPK